MHFHIRSVQVLGTTSQLHNHQVDAIKTENARTDEADRSMHRLPQQMPMIVADGKIYKYVLNSTHKDGAAKAQAFEALGHPIRPGGTEYPLTREMYDHGERLKSQIMTAASGPKAEMTVQEAARVAEGGVKFIVSAPLSGVAHKAGKQAELESVWIDKRKDTEGSKGVLELVTLISQGKKT